MKDETKIWLNFAEENLKSSKILLKSHLYNPTLQNTQQTAEKSLKAIFIEKNIKLKRTHDILEEVCTCWKLAIATRRLDVKKHND